MPPKETVNESHVGFEIAYSLCSVDGFGLRSGIYINNGTFGYGELHGWNYGHIANGAQTEFLFRPFDILGGTNTTMALQHRVGQISFQPGVPSGVNIFRGVTLISGCAYQFDADWGVYNGGGGTNAEGGIFEIGLVGFPVASGSAGSIAANSYEFGHLRGVRKMTSGGEFSLVVYILRPFLPATGLYQYTDNVTVSPFVFDGTFDSQTTGNFSVLGTSNGTSNSTSIVSGPLNSWNMQLRVGQVVSMPNVEEGVNVTQPLHLEKNKRYRIDFMYGARNTGGVSNAQGGRFQVIVNNVVQGNPFDIGSIAAGGTTSSNGFASFTATIGGAQNVGIRVTRHFLPNASVLQYLDDIRISEVDAFVTGTVGLQNWSAPRTGMPALLGFVQDGVLVGESEVSLLNTAGSYAAKTALRGTTDIACKSTHWLSKMNLGRNLVEGTNSANSYSLINGDTFQDSEVNLIDYTRCGNFFGELAEDFGPVWYADLDGDGEVTVVDLGIISATFGQVGDWEF